jgi:hypothetical protein
VTTQKARQIRGKWPREKRKSGGGGGFGFHAAAANIYLNELRFFAPFALLLFARLRICRNLASLNFFPRFLMDGVRAHGQQIHFCLLFYQPNSTTTNIHVHRTRKKSMSKLLMFVFILAG